MYRHIDSQFRTTKLTQQFINKIVREFFTCKKCGLRYVGSDVDQICVSCKGVIQ